ncbi:helix-turn-helix transcriptional regulator [Flavobacteriaceae bacterium]|nr:helix-turn-helix transcriptional regulator [Flavobacteriaceae bacterium]
MLNIEKFILRLEEIMETHQLSAAAFAGKIGVQRSSVSHILSKRNKPSLEFILKIHQHFDSLSLEWLLLGENKSSSPLPENFSDNLFLEEKIPSESRNKPSAEIIKKSIATSDNPELIQIIQLYNDGSFDVFYPKS